METKTCIECHVEKSVDEFYRAGRYYQSRCKPCHNYVCSVHYRQLGVHARSKRIAAIKARKYGFESAEALYDFAERHGDLCDLCHKPDTTHRKRTWTRGLTMDHDPATGRFRGMLCSLCNLAIGNAKDDPILLRRMAEYVEAFR